MGADGIAISADGSRLFYCPLVSRRWYSIPTDALLDRELPDDEVGARVTDEGDKGGGADGSETDDAGRVYLTNHEHNAVLRRLPDGTFETITHDPRLLWPDTMSVTDGYLSTSPPTNYTGRRSTSRGKTCGNRPTTCSARRSTPDPVQLR